MENNVLLYIYDYGPSEDTVTRKRNGNKQNNMIQHILMHAPNAGFLCSFLLFNHPVPEDGKFFGLFPKIVVNGYQVYKVHPLMEV